MKRLALVALLASQLGIGCAFEAAGFGISTSWVIGDAWKHCDAEGSGPDCLAGGNVSPQAADVVTSAIEHDAPESVE